MVQTQAVAGQSTGGWWGRFSPVNKGLQLIGVAVTGLFFYRYFSDPAERESVKASVDAFVKSVTGEK
ncbi:hypothetical protein TSOC_001979 [Tetrabaena socialis]|uniref:Cyanobacterial aminoacyl-tRNA synthetase CAAD domain-containing protein n=1 Tax=Tetrabaena socialis TaxID=47790 RepID=A0A2J8AFB9_9CHLO|nr:hypothetical protein TSOC_001979 [Tetrabaena socialis]|eukprot:PNH11219.1 hypothetical protein TSOC_001979 [Tetrabaena socialis]